MFLLKRILNFNSLQYIKEAYVKPVVIAVVMSLFLVAHAYLNVTNAGMRLLSIIVCFIITMLAVYCIGLTSGEKIKVISTVKNKMKKYGNC